MEKTIERKLEFCSSALIDIKNSIKSYELAKKESDKKLYFTLLKRYCEEAIESIIKVNQILLKKKLKFPKSYAHSFLDLKYEYDFKNVDLDKLSNIAKFRNELAHEYIDMSEYYSLKNAKIIVVELPVYIKELFRLLEKEN